VGFFFFFAGVGGGGMVVCIFFGGFVAYRGGLGGVFLFSGLVGGSVERGVRGFGFGGCFFL